MRYLLIICNITFLLFGNLLFSNIHYFQHHDHNNTLEYNECIDCIIFNSNDNYVLDNNELNFSNNNSNEFILNPIITIEFNLNKRYLSRAPPISK
jgi:hypothetical protein